MEEKTLIARRVAQELRSGNLVSLGIGLPTLVHKDKEPSRDTGQQERSMVVVTLTAGFAVLVVIAVTELIFGGSETELKPVRVRRVRDGKR
jgi:acyl CoA:acetate/3-ketoacid CoA transferase